MAIFLARPHLRPCRRCRCRRLPLLGSSAASSGFLGQVCPFLAVVFAEAVLASGCVCDLGRRRKTSLPMTKRSQSARGGPERPRSARDRVNYDDGLDLGGGLDQLATAGGAVAVDDAAVDKKWSRNEKESLGNKDLERKVKSDVGRH